MDEELETGSETGSETSSESIIIDNSESMEEVKGQLETTTEQLEEIKNTISSVQDSVSGETDYSEITNKLDELLNGITEKQDKIIETLVQNQDVTVEFYNNITDVAIFGIAVVLGAIAIKTFFMGATKW